MPKASLLNCQGFMNIDWKGGSWMTLNICIYITLILQLVIHNEELILAFRYAYSFPKSFPIH